MDTTESTDIMNMVNELDATPLGIELDMRFDVGVIITNGMKRTGKTIEQLAADAGVSVATLRRVLHSNQRITFAAVSRIMHAVGVKGRICARASAADLPPVI